jgi:formylglycine-generating enzyme required for sulfatase activity
MNTTRLAYALAAAVGLLTVPARAAADTFGNGDNTFEIEFVTIGDPGNAADTTGDPTSAGFVDYVYSIAKYEASRDMVEKANAEGGLGLTLHSMSTVTGGPRPDMPATGVSWNEAARFVNWLNTSEGFSAAYNFATQPGEVGYNSNEYILPWGPTDAGYDAANLFRNSQSHFFLPSVNEWYKAAFYDPDANGGDGGYWYFPTGSDSVPTAVASGTAAGTAVWDQAVEQGPADITLAGGLSPYGVMGQGGNVWEWQETEYDSMNDSGSSLRAVRGGDWSSSGVSINLSASLRSGGIPTLESIVGFRVASIPEPSSIWLAALGMMGLMMRRGQ